MLGVPRQYLSVALMLSYKLDFSCTDMDGFSQAKYSCQTIEEDITIATSASKQFSVSYQPLFPMIPLTHVVMDNLHMFLQVADTLIDFLIGLLCTME